MAVNQTTVKMKPEVTEPLYIRYGDLPVGGLFRLLHKIEEVVYIKTSEFDDSGLRTSVNLRTGEVCGIPSNTDVRLIRHNEYVVLEYN